MKKLKLLLTALTLTSALALTGCQDMSETHRSDNFTNETISRISSQTERHESKSFLAAAASNISKPSTTSTSESPTASEPEIPLLPPEIGSLPKQNPEETTAPITPQGNCPYCGGTGHHNNELCGTCHGTGYYEAPTTAVLQGNCPYCGGTGHHNNELCGTCHGTGYYEASTPVTPQVTSGGCHSQNRYQNQGHHSGGHHCH